MKICTSCKKELPLTNFCKDKKGKNGLMAYCRKCNTERSCKWAVENPKKRNARATRWRREHPENVKGFWLRTDYNISMNDYKEMVTKQSNCCAICDQLMEKPNVDHCHKSNKTRELLCRNCNLILGFADDNPQILANAIKYLNKHNSLGQNNQEEIKEQHYE